MEFEHYRPEGPNQPTQNISSDTSKIQILLSAHQTFSRIDHMLVHKTNCNKSKKVEIISSIFFKGNSMKSTTGGKLENLQLFGN